MKRKKILFLAADTPRSQVYSQSFRHAGIRFDAIAMMKKIKDVKSGSSPLEKGGGFQGFIPDFSEPLDETCRDISSSVFILNVESINDSAVMGPVEEIKPDLILFSGFGGEIVKSDLLHAGVPLMHAHPGRLPDYRGSTTLYYSILKEHKCSVTVFYLNKNIDDGRVITVRDYPVPDRSVNIDYVYDNCIRADALVHVLSSFDSEGYEIVKHKDKVKTLPYRIIHPVLKHLAVMSVSTPAEQQ